MSRKGITVSMKKNEYVFKLRNLKAVIDKCLESYQTNLPKRINYDPTNLADPMNPLSPLNPVNPANPNNPANPSNPANPVSPVSPMNPINQPPFIGFCKTYGKSINQEIQYAKNLNVNNADPKELQSHLESSMKILSKENEKIFSKIGPKVKVGDPKQAKFLNKATKGLKTLLTKVKNNYHLEAANIEMSNRSKIEIILGICLIVVSVILFCMYGKVYMNNIFDIFKRFHKGETKDVHEILSLILQQRTNGYLLYVCCSPAIIGCILLIHVYANYHDLKERTEFFGNDITSIIYPFSKITYYY